MTRRPLVITAALCAALVPSAALAAPPVVGTVNSISGTKAVRIAAKPGAKLVPLKVRQPLRLGQRIVMGRGARVVFSVKRPRGVKATADLVTIAGAKGVKYTAKVTRRGALTVVNVRAR